MDYLREGIGLRGYAQRDPLVEYQREGFDMFMAIMDGIKEESVGFLFNLEVQLIEDEDQEEGFVEDEEEPLRRELRSEVQPDAHDHRPQISAKGLDQPRTPEQQLTYSAPSEDDTALAVPAAFGGEGDQRPAGRTVTNAGDEFAEVGRNALCPAARARSTSAATAPPAARPGSPRASASGPGRAVRRSSGSPCGRAESRRTAPRASSGPSSVEPVETR